MDGTDEADFGDDSLSQLRTLADQVELRIGQLEQAMVDDAHRQIQAIASAVGMPLAP